MKLNNMNQIQSFYRCKSCGDIIGANTNRRLVYCKCGKLGIDGNEYYTRILGDMKFIEHIKPSKT